MFTPNGTERWWLQGPPKNNRESLAFAWLGTAKNGVLWVGIGDSFVGSLTPTMARKLMVALESTLREDAV